MVWVKFEVATAELYGYYSPSTIEGQVEESWILVSMIQVHSKQVKLKGINLPLSRPLKHADGQNIGVLLSKRVVVNELLSESLGGTATRRDFENQGTDRGAISLALLHPNKLAGRQVKFCCLLKMMLHASVIAVLDRR